MGFYDTVYSDYPLPDSYAEEYGFQTKDLDCGGKKYWISEEGELLLEEDSDTDDGEKECSVVPFHGVLAMYAKIPRVIHDPPVTVVLDYDEETTLVQSEHLEYRITFTHGQVERIERSEHWYSWWFLDATGCYTSTSSVSDDELERLLAIELEKPDNRRIVIEHEEEPEPEPVPVPPSYTIADIPSELLDKIKKLRIDHFIEKHEGPWEWESFLKYDDACLVHLKEGYRDYQYTVLMPFAERHKATFEEVLCAESSDMLTLFFVCPSLAGMEGEKDNRRWSSFCAICREVPAYEVFEDTRLYVTILLHEVRLSEPEMGDDWAFRQLFRS